MRVPAAGLREAVAQVLGRETRNGHGERAGAQDVDVAVAGGGRLALLGERLDRDAARRPRAPGEQDRPEPERDTEQQRARIMSARALRPLAAAMPSLLLGVTRPDLLDDEGGRSRAARATLAAATSPSATSAHVGAARFPSGPPNACMTPRTPATPNAIESSSA